jgi:hypothetical protein
MEEHLTSKRGIHVSDMLDHFYFNRENSQKRVWTPTYEADAHANNIKMVHDFFAANDITKKHYTYDMKKYFNAFEKNCPEGKFAYLDDVSLYRHVGVNSDGLDLWIQLKGSV